MRKIYNLILVSALCLSSIGCDLWTDVDEVKPYYSQTEEALFTTSEGIEQNVNAMYGRTRGLFSPFSIKYSTEMSGLYSDNRGQNTDAMKVLLTINDNYTNHFYLESYQLVAASNLLIKNLKNMDVDQIPNFSEVRRGEIIGEAKIGRAIGHFDLLKMFGQYYDLNSRFGIPVVTEILKDGPARNTVAEVYKAIEDDLEEAINEAPEGVNGQLFTQQTAKALLAKVALYKKDYTNASAIALDVINNSGYVLEPNYADVFSKGLKSQEVIFAPNAEADYSEFNGIWNFNGNQPTAMLTNKADSQVGTADDGVYDPRYDQSIVSFGSGKFGKYPFTVPGSIFYLRLAEMYFIYAEAQARLANDNAVAGDTNFDNALAKVNDLRDRVSMTHAAPANKAALLETIRIDKMMELILERGEPWYDMVRYHFYGDVDISSIRGFNIEDYQLIYPFHSSTLNGNTKLEQNPGYIGSEEE
jgi:hypothetical protein